MDIADLLGELTDIGDYCPLPCISQLQINSGKYSVSLKY